MAKKPSPPPASVASAAKAAPAAKPAAGKRKPPVMVHPHGAATLLKKISDAGHTEALTKALKGKKPVFTLGLANAKPVFSLERPTFDAINDFVKTAPTLKDDASVQGMLTCDPDDPYTICW